MNILDKIIAHKKLEVAEKSSLVPVKLLEQSVYFDSSVVSMKKYIKHEDKTGIIAEFKRKSPSKGAINTNASVETVSIGYMQAGASALSILTDKEFFGGKNEDLTTARKFNFCPILRKDFIIDEYQIIEAKSIGADCILLIAACLDDAQMAEMEAVARSLDMAVLVEVHDRAELDRALKLKTKLVGINNRNLKTFEVSLQTTLDMLPAVPADRLLVTESGILSVDDVKRMREAHVNAFLVGEAFMRANEPGEALAKLFA